MHPTLFEFGPFKVYSFGTMIAVAALAAGLFAYWAMRRHALTRKYLFDTILYTLFFGLLGARVVFYLIYSDQFQSIWQIFFIWQGGLVALGGILVGFLVFIYFLKQNPQRLWLVADIFALAFLLAWAIGKQGCVLSSCTAGKISESWLAINGSFPVDLMSSLWALTLFIILLLVWLKQIMRDGAIFLLSLEGFFLGELVIRSLKEDFDTGLGRAEAIVQLIIVVVIYIAYWRLYNPKMVRLPKKLLSLSRKWSSAVIQIKLFDKLTSWRSRRGQS